MPSAPHCASLILDTVYWVMGLLFLPLLLGPKSVQRKLEFLFHNICFLWALTSIVLRMGHVGLPQWSRLRLSAHAGGLGSIPVGGVDPTRQRLRLCILQVKNLHGRSKIPQAMAKTWCSEIKQYFKKIK